MYWDLCLLKIDARLGFCCCIYPGFNNTYGRAAKISGNSELVINQRGRLGVTGLLDLSGAGCCSVFQNCIFYSLDLCWPVPTWMARLGEYWYLTKDDICSAKSGIRYGFRCLNVF